MNSYQGDCKANDGLSSNYIDNDDNDNINNDDDGENEVISSATKNKYFDFHRTPIISEAKRLSFPLENLLKRISVLLIQFHGHPGLVSLAKIANRLKNWIRH